jgi:23S rRNA (uracil1939-C5)-methyltransferase
VKIDGYPLFVKGMMKDEEGELIVTLMKKTYGYAKLHKLHKANPMRIQPQCALAKQCGGCQLQHMDYAEQKAFKTQKVKDIIQRIGKCNASPSLPENPTGTTA